MIKTSFHDDFLQYYKKARMLQERNSIMPKGALSNIQDIRCGDPIMDAVTIYDTVNRKFAGFSKVLEDIHGVRVRKDLVKLKDYTEMLSIEEFHFLHLVHRFTGSGASFQPTYLSDGSRNPKEHGYHNNIVGRLAEVMVMDGIEGARGVIVANIEPMVTSVGNQPPSLKNGDPSKYRLAQQYYFDNVAEEFIKDYLFWLKAGDQVGIKAAVDFCCAWHKKRGFKQWHFVMTAFVMDTAEYYPELVDRSSHCYYGANCIRAFDLMFTKEKSDIRNKAEWYESCMQELVYDVKGNPYDIEDVCCDVIRYWVEHIPKGYEDLPAEKRVNNSTLKVNGKYTDAVQLRIDEVLK